MWKKPKLLGYDHMGRLGCSHSSLPSHQWGLSNGHICWTTWSSLKVEFPGLVCTKKALRKAQTYPECSGAAILESWMGRCGQKKGMPPWNIPAPSGWLLLGLACTGSRAYGYSLLHLFDLILFVMEVPRRHPTRPKSAILNRSILNSTIVYLIELTFRKVSLGLYCQNLAPNNQLNCR